jgi:hypothetical protein
MKKITLFFLVVILFSCKKNTEFEQVRFILTSSGINAYGNIHLNHLHNGSNYVYLNSKLIFDTTFTQIKGGQNSGHFFSPEDTLYKFNLKYYVGGILVNEVTVDTNSFGGRLKSNQIFMENNYPR